jgi:hypothetical protein
LAGSSPELGLRALGAAIADRVPPLAAFIVGHTASFGGAPCFQTDAQMLAELPVNQRTGRPYHIESVGRSRRLVEQLGRLSSKRVFAGQKPVGARFASAHGTTEKRVIWASLGMKAPTTKRDAARVRAQQEENQRAYQAIHSAPRHSAPVPEPLPPPPELAALFERLGSRVEARVQREEQEHDAAQVAAARLSKQTGPPE